MSTYGIILEYDLKGGIYMLGHIIAISLGVFLIAFLIYCASRKGSNKGHYIIMIIIAVLFTLTSVYNLITH